MKRRNYFSMKTLLALMVPVFLISCEENEVPIVAQFSTEKTSYYTDEEIVFTNTSTGGTGELTYTWDFGNEQTSTEKEPVMSYQTPGLYVVKLTASDGKSSAITQKTLFIELAPEPDKGVIELKWIGQQYLNDIRSVSPAVDNDGNILMTSEDHILRKFSKTDGAQLWSFDLWNTADGVLPEGNTLSSPSIDTDGTIYVGSGNTSNKVGRFYAINSNGTKKWLISADLTNGFWNSAGGTPTPRIQYLTAAVGANSVFIGNTGTTGSVLAINKANGTRRGYVTNAAGTGGPTGGVSTGVLLTKSNNLVWYGGTYGLFMASATSLEAGITPYSWDLWLNPSENRAEQSVAASMAISADGTIYGLASFNANAFGGPSAFAVNQDGTVKWKTSLNCGVLDQGGVVVDKDDKVYVTMKATLGESNGGVAALNGQTGEIIWKYAIPEDVTGTPAIDQTGNIHFATDKGNYYIIKNDGSADPVIVKQDLTALIIDSESTYASGWVRGKAKCWSSPVITENGTIYVGITNTETRSKSLLLALKHQNVTGLQEGAPWPMKAQNRRHTNVQP